MGISGLQVRAGAEPGFQESPSFLSGCPHGYFPAVAAGLAQDMVLVSLLPVWLEKQQERKNCPLCLKTLCFEELLADLEGEEMSPLTHLQWLCPANTHCLGLLKILPLLLFLGQRQWQELP